MARKLRKNGKKTGTRPVTPSRVKKVIEGSGGITSAMAERLGCSYSALKYALKEKTGDAWDEVRELVEIEREQIVDIAEGTNKEMMLQRLEPSVALKASHFTLDRLGKSRGYGKSSELTLQGGENPLRIEAQTLIPIEDLDLPVKVKRQVLRAMEKKLTEEKEGEA